MPNQAGDVGHIDSTHNTITNAPVLPANGTLTLTDFRIDHYSGTVTLNGGSVLTVNASTFSDSAATVAGTGSLYLDSGALSMPGSANHHWVGTAVKVQNATVSANNYLEINGTGQIGPDAGATGSLTDHGCIDIKDPGAGQIGVGYASIDVKSDGEMWAVGTTHLVNVQSGAASTHNLFALTNAHNLTVGGAYTLDLSGGYFSQTGGTTSVGQAGGLMVEDTLGYSDGVSTYTKNFSVTGGEVDMFPFTTIGAVRDTGFNGGDLAIKSPGQYQHTVNQEQLTEHCFVTIKGSNVKFLGSGTDVAFQNYTPPDTNAGTDVQTGCNLKVVGNLYLDGNTHVWLRAQPDAAVGANAYDTIRTDPLGNYNVTLNGSSLQLTVDVSNVGTKTSLAMTDFIKASGTGVMTAPTTPFGTVNITGVTSWSFSSGPTADATSIDGTLHN